MIMAKKAGDPNHLKPGEWTPSNKSEFVMFNCPNCHQNSLILAEPGVPILFACNRTMDIVAREQELLGTGQTVNPGSACRFVDHITCQDTPSS
jgi:ribosomal protein S27E